MLQQCPWKGKNMNTELRKIADNLLLKSSYIQDIGLFHGKMGVVVSLYAYANKYQDQLLEDFAWDLLQQIYENVHTDMPIGMEYGLAGIGYGTTLLSKLGLVECDLNSVLADVDAKIMERDPRRMSDYSVRTGAGGVLLYLSLRQETGGALLTFDNQYVAELKSAAARMVLNPVTNILDILNKPLFDINCYMEKPIGIDGGSAYYILKDILL